MTGLAPAHVGSLVADLVVHLPGDDGFFVAVMFCHPFCQSGRLFQIDIVVETVAAAGTERLTVSVFVFVHDLRIPVIHPGRNGGGRNAHQDMQTVFLRLFDHFIEEREVILPFFRFETVPGKIADADRVGSKFDDVVQIFVDKFHSPLFGVIVYTAVFHLNSPSSSLYTACVYSSCAIM